MSLLLPLALASTATAEPLSVVYGVRHGSPDWTLDGRDIVIPRYVQGVYVTDPVPPHDLGLKSTRQSRPAIDQSTAAELLAAGPQVCVASVDVDEGGKVLSTMVSECDPALAGPVGEAVRGWSWIKGEPGLRTVEVAFRLAESWWLDGAGCLVQYQASGSGMPSPEGSGIRECQVQPSQAQLVLSSLPNGPKQATCVGTLTTPGTEPPVVDGCPEPWAQAWQELLSTWSFQPNGSGPTSFRALLHIDLR